MIKFYMVGGSVRDKMLGEKPNDIDYCVEAPSFEAMKEAIEARGEKVFLSTPQYYTVRATRGKEVVDYVWCRKEGPYSDGRRPDWVEPGTLHDDLSRRDFTMNAMAIDEDGMLHDPFDGECDIMTGQIVAVGDAVDRLTEDALRALRALRFSITKSMRLDLELKAALGDPKVLDKLASVSVDRVREELTKMMKHSWPSTVRTIYEYPALFGVIHRNCPDLWFKPTTEKR